MLDVKKLLTKILTQISTTETQSLASTNWTATSASFVSGSVRTFCNVDNFMLTVKTTSAYTAGTEYTLGTIKNLANNNMEYCVGIVAQGTITGQTSGVLRFIPIKSISNNSNLYIRIMRFNS